MLSIVSAAGAPNHAKLLLIGAVAAWLSVHAALVIYLLTPLFYITPPEWHGKVQPAADEKKS